MGLASIRRASALEPADIWYRMEAARVLWRLGQADASRREVMAAQALADDDNDRRYVKEFLEFLDKAGKQN